MRLISNSLAARWSYKVVIFSVLSFFCLCAWFSNHFLIHGLFSRMCEHNGMSTFLLWLLLLFFAYKFEIGRKWNILLDRGAVVSLPCGVASLSVYAILCFLISFLLATLAGWTMCGYVVSGQRATNVTFIRNSNYDKQQSRLRWVNHPIIGEKMIIYEYKGPFTALRLNNLYNLWGIKNLLFFNKII